MPRALTERERLGQRAKLLDMGKPVVIMQGVRKVSVDEIARAAGMAKGTFYQHFHCKEAYLAELIWQVHATMFARAAELIENADDLEATVRAFLLRLFDNPELAYFLRDAQDISAVLSALPDHGEQDFTRLEEGEYQRLLELAGVDTTVVKPGVVHNYIHAMYLMKTSDLMIAADVGETHERMVDGLLAYIMKGLT